MIKKATCFESKIHSIEAVGKTIKKRRYRAVSMIIKYIFYSTGGTILNCRIKQQNGSCRTKANSSTPSSTAN